MRIQSLSGLNGTTVPPDSVTLFLPKNTIAASTMMAALTKKAIVKATTESIVLKRMARPMDRWSFPSLRVCTRAECK